MAEDDNGGELAHSPVIPGQCEPDSEGHPFRVIMRCVTKRERRVTAAAVGLLVLAGCVVLVVVLTVADRQDDAARVGRILGTVFAAIPLAILLIRWWRQPVPEPTAGQDTSAEHTQPIKIPVDRRVSAKRRRAHTAVMIAFAAVISVVLTIVTAWLIVGESPPAAVNTVRLEVERQPALFASIWEQSTGQLWQARHGMDAAQYQQTFTDLVAQGYRLVRVSGYSDAGQDRYAAVWEQRPGPEWHARHGLTPDQYQQSFTELAAQGFRLVDVSGYTSGGQERYAAIWERASGPAWQARNGLTAGEYQKVFDQLAEQGFRLVRVSVHTVGGEDRFAGIWEQRPGPAWQARYGLTAGEYQKVFDELTGQGFRLVDVSGYGAGESRYAAVFEQVDGPAWQARHGLTSFWHQREFQQLAAGGMRLVAVDGHNPNG